MVHALAASEGRKAIGTCVPKTCDNVQVLGRFQILSFTEPAIDRFTYLKGLKLGVRHADLRIAAITLEHGGMLVTRNLRDFRGIPGLAIADWSS